MGDIKREEIYSLVHFCDDYLNSNLPLLLWSVSFLSLFAPKRDIQVQDRSTKVICGHSYFYQCHIYMSDDNLFVIKIVWYSCKMGDLFEDLDISNLMRYYILHTK